MTLIACHKPTWHFNMLHSHPQPTSPKLSSLLAYKGQPVSCFGTECWYLTFVWNHTSVIPWHAGPLKLVTCQIKRCYYYVPHTYMLKHTLGYVKKWRFNSSLWNFCPIYFPDPSLLLPHGTFMLQLSHYCVDHHSFIWHKCCMLCAACVQANVDNIPIWFAGYCSKLVCGRGSGVVITCKGLD